MTRNYWPPFLSRLADVVRLLSPSLAVSNVPTAITTVYRSQAKKTQRCNDALRAILEHGSQLDLRNCQDIFIPRQPPIPTKCSHSVFSLLPMPAHHPATRHTHVAMFIYLIL